MSNLYESPASWNDQSYNDTLPVTCQNKTPRQPRDCDRSRLASGGPNRRKIIIDRLIEVYFIFAHYVETCTFKCFWRGSGYCNRIYNTLQHPTKPPYNVSKWGKENKRESDVNKTMFGIMSSIWLPQTSRTYSGYTHNIRLCTV